jgi:branched-chain amino acid transport system ATP-binding protein
VTLLSVQNLTKSFGGVAAARDVSFSLERGELLAIIGPNGAGKSTVFNMVGGQLRPDRGAVVLDGQGITNIAPQKRFRLGVGRTFQVAQTFLSMTVIENVQMALLSHARETGGLWSPAHLRHRDEAMSLLTQVGMEEAADNPCSALAYGDVKRVELAIALAGQPKLLLMDEPTAGMAARERSELMELTSAIADAKGIGVLFTEHDMDVVFGHAERVIVLVRGQIIAAGTPDEIRRHEEVRRAYLGDDHALERPKGVSSA